MAKLRKGTPNFSWDTIDNYRPLSTEWCLLKLFSHTHTKELIKGRTWSRATLKKWRIPKLVILIPLQTFSFNKWSHISIDSCISHCNVLCFLLRIFTTTVVTLPYNLLKISKELYKYDNVLLISIRKHIMRIMINIQKFTRLLKIISYCSWSNSQNLWSLL